MGKPMAVPRSQGFHERRQSSRVSHSEPLIGSTWASSWRIREATQSVSPTAKSPTATVTTSTPLSRCWLPKVNRGWPVRASIPISPRANPKKRLTRPRTRDDPSRAVMAVKASTIRATYSAGPKLRATSAITGARKVNPNVAMVPATKEPMAAVARAAAPRPRLAILLPSRAVTIEADSPGVLRRIEVVEPPYMPP